MQKVIHTDESVKLASTYFTKVENSNKLKYIGPKGEYQKWYYVLHKEYKNKRAKEWVSINKERNSLRSKHKGYILRFMEKLNALRKVSNTLEPCCSVCGIRDIRVLTINHLNGDGAKERSATPYRVSRIYRDILKGREVSDLDIRCYNCNVLYEYEQGRRNLPLNWENLYYDRT